MDDASFSGRGDMFQQQREHEERWKLFLMAMRLAHWLHEVASRTEVAGLVVEAAHAFDVAVGSAHLRNTSDLQAAEAAHQDALSRLARLAGGGE